jgi:hypothetical protein
MTSKLAPAAQSQVPKSPMADYLDDSAGSTPPAVAGRPDPLLLPFASPSDLEPVGGTPLPALGGEPTRVQQHIPIANNPTDRLFSVPTVFRQGSWTIRIHAPPREHPPPHVHVIYRGTGEVIILLGTMTTAPVEALHADSN